jgi:hypothetical protein
MGIGGVTAMLDGLRDRGIRTMIVAAALVAAALGALSPLQAGATGPQFGRRDGLRHRK